MRFFELTTRYHENGRTCAKMRIVEAAHRPEDVMTATPEHDTYTEYYDNITPALRSLMEHAEKRR